MSADEVAGWYGKVTMLGDFASRRLSPEWVRWCDQWLSEGVRVSREALGESWQSVYLSAPVWRFAWGPGLVDTRWWFGVLMPSCDSVGRYFPLVIAAPRAQAPSDRVTLDHLDLWWRYMAQAGLSTLGDGATLDAFEQTLHQAPPWPSAARPSSMRSQTERGYARWQLAPDMSLNELAGGLSGAFLGQLLSGGSAWWPLTGPGAAGSCSLLPGMPSAASFSDLLTGRW